MDRPLLSIMLLSAVVPSLQAAMTTGIEAVVDNSVITYYEVDALTQATADALQRRFAGDARGFENKLNQMRGENLDILLDQQLVLHEFKTAGYTLPDSVIDEIVQERIRRQYGDRAKMTKDLERQGLTYEKFRQQVRDQFIVQELRRKNVSSEIIVSPHKIETYYQAHRDEYKVDDEIRLRVIVLKPSLDAAVPSPVERAKEILGKLAEGVPFAELATTYSEGSQRSQGGDWGWWQRGSLTKGLSDAAFGLPKGAASGLLSRLGGGDDYWLIQYKDGKPAVGRHYGLQGESRKQTQLEEREFSDASALASLPPAQEFYLLQVEDTRPAHYKSVSEMRPEIEEILLKEEQQQLEKQWLDRLRKKTFVRRF